LAAITDFDGNNDEPLIDNLPGNHSIKGSRKNKFTFLALSFRLGLVDFKEQKAQ
jgi:hypothetical protein